MICLFFRYHIANYGRWKEAFDRHLPARQAGGATHDTLILRRIDNPNEIIVVLGWKNQVTAERFIQSVSWQLAQGQMGVIGTTEVRLWWKLSKDQPSSIR